MFFPVCNKVIEQKYSVECARPPFNATIKKLKMKKWSSQWTQFMQLRKEAWKNSGLHRGLNPWPRWLPVRCSTNWAMKPLTLGAGQLWVHMFPWKKWVLMIYEINHNCGNEMKMKKKKKNCFAAFNSGSVFETKWSNQSWFAHFEIFTKNYMLPRRSQPTESANWSQEL